MEISKANCSESGKAIINLNDLILGSRHFIDFKVVNELFFISFFMIAKILVYK